MLFTLFDIKSQTYGPIFECNTVDEAKRNLTFAIKSGKDPVITQCPEDFNLMCLDENLSNLTDLLSHLDKKVVCNAQECYKLAFSVQSIEIENSNSDVINDDLIEKGSEVEHCL